MIDNKNIILAVVLSILILVGFEAYFSATRPPPDEQATAQKTPPSPGQSSQAPAVPGTPPLPAPAPGARTPGLPAAPARPDATLPVPPGGPTASDWRVIRQAALKKGNRVKINTPRLRGSIALNGARLDDLTLTDYRETLEPDSPEIVMLVPKGTDKAYFAEFGWIVDEGQTVPNADTPWRANRDTLSPESPVTLSWDNGQGLKFSRTFAIDKNYMFTVTQKVKNTGTKAVTLYNYGLISRRGTPEVFGYYFISEGATGVFEGQLDEVDYSDLQEEKIVKHENTTGWIGIKDQYWLTALVPDQKTRINTRFTYRKENGDDMYQVDYLSAPITVAPGGTGEARSHLFSGAKEVNLLEEYRDGLGIENFHMAIDYTKLFFLTIPLHKVLLYFHELLGNFGLSILLVTVAIKLVFFPLANKSYTSMSAMKKLQPQVVKLKERFGEDKARLNEEMMALYKREKVNPASGCLPIVIQIPVFISLYFVLFVTIEPRQAPFYGWIQDLSVADPTSLFNLFGLIPWTPPDFLMIGVWPLIMGLSMFVQQKLNPQPTDPMQAKIFLLLPILFTFLLARFPAGLVIYWAWNNILSMAQQWIIMRRMGITGKQALK